MIKIQQIATVEELYDAHGAHTGNIFVDGVVEFLQHVPSHESSACAAYLHVDQHLLTGVIKIFLGLPLKEVIIRWRLLQALDLLDDHKLSYEEVAARCGYADTKRLGALMMKYYGTTLETYRTGKLRRNSSYSINATAAKRRAVHDNARNLRHRKKGEE